MMMRLTRFLITSLIDRRKTWFVAAGDMGSAWRLFVADGYGGHVHDAGSYDIRYHSFIIIHRKRPKKGSSRQARPESWSPREAAAKD